MRRESEKGVVRKENKNVEKREKRILRRLVRKERVRRDSKKG